MDSVTKLKKFLKENYIDFPEQGSTDMSCAIRDLLTDTIHIANDIGIDIHQRLLDAEEVYKEEAQGV